MTFIKTIDIDQADGIVKNEYDKGIRRSGRVFNILKIMSQSPTALKESCITEKQHGHSFNESANSFGQNRIIIGKVDGE